MRQDQTRDQATDKEGTATANGLEPLQVQMGWAIKSQVQTRLARTSVALSQRGADLINQDLPKRVQGVKSPEYQSLIPRVRSFSPTPLNAK